VVKHFRGVRGDVYASAALNIIDGKLNDLTKTVYQVSETAQAEQNLSVANALEREGNKSKIRNEINKYSSSQSDSVEGAAQEVLRDFNRYFPAYSDFTQEQKEAFIGLMRDGEIQILCK
jgi:hypothetical protein